MNNVVHMLIKLLYVVEQLGTSAKSNDSVSDLLYLIKLVIPYPLVALQFNRLHITQCDIPIPCKRILNIQAKQNSVTDKYT